MKLLVLGANGRTGREMLEQALHAGDSVTALVRRTGQLAGFGHCQLEVCGGDPCDPTLLQALLPGHDAVISVLGPRWPTKGAASIYPKSAAALVEAMARTEVRRLLVTSSGLVFSDASPLTRGLKWLVPNIVDGATRMGARIGASGLDWTVVAVGFLNNGRAMECRTENGSLPAGGGGVSRAALARFLLTEARKAEHLRQVVGLSA